MTPDETYVGCFGGDPGDEQAAPPAAASKPKPAKSAKMLDGPPENKAIAGPDEDKAGG